MLYLLVLTLVNPTVGSPIQIHEINKTLAECIGSATAIIQATANANLVLGMRCDAVAPEKKEETSKPKTEERSF